MKTRKLFEIVGSMIIVVLFAQSTFAENYIGYGWSAADTPSEAVSEALNMARQTLPDREISYILYFTTIDYDSQAVLQAFQEHTAPDVQIHGATSAVGTMGSNNWREGGSVALLAFATEQIAFGVGHAEIGEDPIEAGYRAALAAQNNAGKNDELPKIVLISGTLGHEEKLIQGIETVFGSNTPILGGTPSDNDLSGQWKQYSRGMVTTDGLVLTALYTDLEIGFEYSTGTGYLKQEFSGIVTKSDGHIIYEIDHRPAADVYNEWLNGSITEQVETGGSVVFEGIYDPLAHEVFSETTNKKHHLAIHPIRVILPEKALQVVAMTEEGQKITMLHGDKNAHRNRPAANALLARARGPKNAIAGAVLFTCGCTKLILETDEEIKNIVLRVNKVLNDKPFIGAFTAGEQGYIPGIGNRHQNIVSLVIVFGEEKS